jgi:branched-chain amino acid transport system permease protein
MDIVIIGLLLGGTYALMAMGLQLQYGVARIMNLANGEILIAGAFSTFWFYAGTKVSPLLALFLVAPAAFALNWAIYRVLIFPLVRRAKSQGKLEVDSILVTFGISFIGVGILLAIFGGEYLDYSYLAQPIFIFGERYGLNRVVAFLASAALCAGLYLWLHKTRAGLALRAVSVNPGAASLVSINVARASGFAFALGGAVTAVGGGLLSMFLTSMFARRGVHAQARSSSFSAAWAIFAARSSPPSSSALRRPPSLPWSIRASRSPPPTSCSWWSCWCGRKGCSGGGRRERDRDAASCARQGRRYRPRAAQPVDRRLDLRSRRPGAAGLRRLCAAARDLDRDVYGARHIVAAVLRPTNYIALSTAAFFGIGMYTAAGASISCPIRS